MKNAIRVICSDRQEDLKLLSKKKKKVHFTIKTFGKVLHLLSDDLGGGF